MCPQLLEYVGAMGLTAESSVGRMIGYDRKVTWKGYEPYDFYCTYVRELKKAHLYHTDHAKDDIQAFIQEWEGKP